MAKPTLSLRVTLPNGGRLGPGKADLLDAIKSAGSVGGAAQTLGMSYPRALKLISQLNDAFNTPLVRTSHGGKDGGGAELTETGALVLATYRALQTDAGAAAVAHLASISKLAKPVSD